MARTQSQKLKRISMKHSNRQALAAKRRRDMELESVWSKSAQPSRFLQKIRSDKESMIALRHRLHNERVTYVASEHDNKAHKRVRLNHIPLSRVAVTTRHERLVRQAARKLRGYHTLAKRLGVSKADMFKEFKLVEPSLSFLLKLD